MHPSKYNNGITRKMVENRQYFGRIMLKFRNIIASGLPRVTTESSSIELGAFNTAWQEWKADSLCLIKVITIERNYAQMCFLKSKIETEVVQLTLMPYINALVIEVLSFIATIQFYFHSIILAQILIPALACLLFLKLCWP